MASSLTPADRRLCAIYGVIALVALIATQTSLVIHLVDGGTPSSFVTDSVVNPAATFLTLDAVLAALSALVLMVVESRRIGIPRVWLYVALSFIIAISVALPLFLIERQRRLAQTRVRRLDESHQWCRAGIGSSRWVSRRVVTQNPTLWPLSSTGAACQALHNLTLTSRVRSRWPAASASASRRGTNPESSRQSWHTQAALGPRCTTSTT